MIKEVIKYTDLNGNEKEEVAFFHLNKLEATKLQIKYRKVIQAGEEAVKSGSDDIDYEALIDLFLNIIEKAYGVKSEDGTKFIRNEATTKEFMESEAFSEFFYNLMSNDNKAEKFIKGMAGQNA